jgi:hypothetical protein
MENVAHADHEIGEISEISEIKANYKYPKLGNSTKVVRIFVIRPGRTLDQIVAQESPTRADVFVDVALSDVNGLKPMTWLGEPGVLVAHDQAHHKHRSGTIPVLKGKYRDQIEWQCDVPFTVSAIQKVTDEDHMHGFVNYKGQDEPFVKTLGEMNARGGGPDRPIRSGPTKIVEGKFFHVPWKQLYKAHFKLEINGGMDLDPDVYCEWH